MIKKREGRKDPTSIRHCMYIHRPCLNDSRAIPFHPLCIAGETMKL